MSARTGWSSFARRCFRAAARPRVWRSRERNSGRLRRADDRPADRVFRDAGANLRTRPARIDGRDRGVAADAVGGRGGRTAPRQRAAPARTVPPPQSRARRHRGAGAHARAICSTRWTTATISPSSTTISSICSRRGSTGAFWCCGGSTGRRRLRSWKRSSATRRCTRFTAGTICAAASICPIAAATRFFIRRWSTSR